MAETEMTLEQACTAANTSMSTLNRAIRKGELRASRERVKCVIKREHLEAWMARRQAGKQRIGEQRGY